jgi:3-keto-5-aminohexanoate cleavage enzyme
MQDEKLLVTVAPCIPPYMAAGFPGLDLSPDGIASEVVRAYNAGANLVHLHVWDAEGNPTVDLSVFQRTLSLIKEKCDIIIEGSTGGLNSLSRSERSISLQADIELASLNTGSINYENEVYTNSPKDIEYWASEMHRRGIKPNISIFDSAMISTSLELIHNGLIVSPFLFSFVLGQKGAMPASARNLMFLSESLPPESYWCVAGHGGHDLWMASLAMNMGGHIRAGFEDNAYYRRGELANSNAQLIERLVRIAHEMGRDIASPSEARKILGLPQRDLLQQ